MRGRDAWIPILIVGVALAGLGYLITKVSLFPIADNKYTDHTDDQRYWGGYERNQIYETKTDLLYDGAVLRRDFYWPINGGVQTRTDFDEYVSHEDKYAGITLIPAGSRFEIMKVEEVVSFNYSSVTMYAKFIDGPCQSEIFDVYGISTHSRAQDVGYLLQSPSDVVMKTSAP